jgi:hypothetical protein
VPNDDELKRDILEKAHHMFTVQPSSTKMYQNMKKKNWWNNMKRDVARYVAQCSICQQVKAEHQRPARLLHLLHVLEWKWDEVAMDFVVALPRAPSGQDTIWVVIDRLTKSAHFIPLKIIDSMQKLAELYIKEIVKLHGILAAIFSYQDPWFTSKFWKSLHKAMGTKLNLLLPTTRRLMVNQRGPSKF